MKSQVGKFQLPTAPKQPIRNPSLFTVLVYGRPKIGKTTLFSQWPDALFLTTEPGTKGMSIYEVECKSWGTVRRVVQALEENPKRFKTVVIDTVDRAYDMCLDYTCKQLGIDYPGEDERGREDFGKSWRKVKSEFLGIITRIVQSGRGLCCTSHMRVETIKSRSGITYDRIIPSMGKQSWAVVEALVDVYLYAEYFRNLKSGRTERVLVCEGDETVWAGVRKTVGKFPRFLPLLEEGGYVAFVEAFRGKHSGIDPRELEATMQTPEVARKFVRQARKEADGKRKVRAKFLPERRR